MKKPIIFIACLFFIFFVNKVLAQDQLKMAEEKDTKRDTKEFNLLSLDNRNEKVKIIPEYVNHVLSIKSSKDGISITGFWDVTPEASLLNKNFIEIKYEVRGGSNLGLGNTLIICVSNGKLFEAMHALRYTRWESGDYKTDYHIKTLLNGNNKNDYKLIVNVHDDVYSKNNPEQNYTHDDRTQLSFDAQRNVFYSVKKDVENQVIKPNRDEPVKQKARGNFPVLILGKESYYFINNRWYQQKYSNEMDEVLN